MNREDIHRVIPILRRQVKRWKEPALGVVQKETRDPFLILTSCVVSLRTKDAVTEAASKRLSRIAPDAASLAALPVRGIERAIYPACFYRVKAGTLKSIGRDLLARFGGRVPDSLDELLTLKGVGRKTANLVVTLAFRKPGICVDTHVHRISNRWGYIRTKTPDESEAALRRKLPRRYWIEYNDLLVPYGQNLCGPVSPRCSECRISTWCSRTGVRFSR